MIVTAWILFIVFGLISLASLADGFRDKDTSRIILIFIVIIITALSAGVIWGGLLN